MSLTPRTATRGLGALLRVPGSAEIALPALLRWSDADPWAVRLVLLVAETGEGPGEEAPESVEWVLARDLFTVGLLAPAADEGVQVRVDGDCVVVELAGAASALLPLQAVQAFLDESEGIVATGSESVAALAALDRELAALLS